MTNEAALPCKPFALGTTSFIFPDYILPNVRKLGTVFDEIELLVFESHPKEVLPSKQDVRELLDLSCEMDLRYNIHLPTDVSLTCESSQKRQNAADTLLTVMDLFAPLSPTTHTLHLEMPREIQTESNHQKRRKVWEEHTRLGLERVLAGIRDPGRISVETLDYPFYFVEKLVAEFNLSVCIDAGHQIKYGHTLFKTFETHQSKTAIIHLHGVDFSGKTIKDHTALDRLPEKHAGQVRAILKKFTGTVSLEVFNLENLNRSLGFLSAVFKDIPSAVSKN